MNKTFENLYRSLLVAIATAGIFAFDASAAVTNRPTAANNAAANRAQNRTVGRAPTMTAPKATATTPVDEPEIIQDEPTPEPEVEDPIIVDNKTSVFDDVMSEIGASDTDAAANARAEAIRRQRALLDGASNQTTGPSVSITANACDAELRKCMMERCGNDFTKCANDSSAIWGQKIEGCRAKTKCTAHEFTLLAPEILADRDANVKMQHYNSVINCGNRYNDCIFTQCGTTLNKCLAKKDGDNAISKCASIANECKSMDNGLASRAMSVFGNLRTIATARVKADEARLYELRDLMRTQCNRFGAMFDERTLDCVYTVNFFAGEDNTLMASKKLYSGDSFQCNANWFGVDITTYIENAQRLTRSQKSASAAALGAGLGTAAGMLSSGAIGRAIKSQKAERARDEAACQKAGGTWGSNKCTDADGNKIEFDENGDIVDDNKKSSQREKTNRNPTPKEESTPSIAEAECAVFTDSLTCGGGQKCKWNNGKCVPKSKIAQAISNIANRKQPQTTPKQECEALTEQDPCIESEKCTWKNDQCTPNIIGQQCGADDARNYTGYGTWVQTEGGQNECFVKNNNSDVVNCLCIQSECINKKSYSIYQLKDENGETVPFANIKCDGLSSEGLEAISYIDQIPSHYTNFDGEFCIEPTINDDARCTIECIGYNALTGTMKQLKNAIKDNSLTICSGAIRLDREVEFGESCDQK